eukprot:scaffold20658_cov101-Isochrysis_galbana.AAC.2
MDGTWTAPGRNMDGTWTAPGRDPRGLAVGLGSVGGGLLWLGRVSLHTTTTEIRSYTGRGERVQARPWAAIA